jgi:hypothetical protein
MEVHHHPHVEKKKIKEYFLEFIMIFLAVTMGFFAESLREHVNENSKESEYINSLRKDLTTDMINIKEWTAGFNTRIQQYDSVVNMLRQPEKITNSSRLYYLARLSTRGTVFEDNNNTMIQLNISGNFRLIRNKALAEKIVAYQNDIDDYKRVSEYDSYEARAFYEPQMKLFDAFIFNDMSRPITDSSVTGTNTLLGGFQNVFREPPGSPQLLSTDKGKINDYIYILHQRRSTFAAEILILHKQKEDAAALIQMIDKEFGINDN